MFELFEKAVLTALGAAALTQKKGEELIQEMKSRYKISEEEGRAFLDRIQEMARTGQQKTAEVAETEVKKALDRMGMVSRDDFEKLERRVRALEALSAESVTSQPEDECLG
ncbi:phasin family protein [Geomonas sp. Red69]|uniref:Phasin family protein n=1 Tax=Geomonas diazotrophica TaxID=2843197 RepID=A0ABX8JJ44_9BACT|nr:MULTISPECIES: phasin family protein [Geomonas]MBU5638310.1 phasin family protein [Geomonas diazotrophica]QWV96687.1 phasin family protein [Geomonas nitrogeniifigens]QXE85790.1 phasin family protein [Geomonas nitrogeniifigens]